MLIYIIGDKKHLDVWILPVSHVVIPGLQWKLKLVLWHLTWVSTCVGCQLHISATLTAPLCVWLAALETPASWQISASWQHHPNNCLRYTRVNAVGDASTQGHACFRAQRWKIKRNGTASPCLISRAVQLITGDRSVFSARLQPKSWNTKTLFRLQQITSTARSQGGGDPNPWHGLVHWWSSEGLTRLSGWRDTSSPGRQSFCGIEFLCH